MVDETQFAVGPFPEMRGATLELSRDTAFVRQLGKAIVDILVKAFKGNECYGVVSLVGSSLEAYADTVA